MAARSIIGRARSVYEASAGLRQSVLAGVLFALAAVSIGATIRFMLGDLFRGLPFITVFPAVIVTAFFCGWRAGLVAAVLGGALAWYYWILPGPALFRTDVSAWIGIVLYITTAGVIVLLTAGMHRGFTDMDEAARVRETINEELERRVGVRTAQLETANVQLRLEARQREVAEAQVRQLQKLEAVGQLTGGVAHDFNNMLAIVVGSVELAKRNLDSDRAKVDRSLDNALDGAQRAAQLTARLLAFSRQAALEPRTLDPNKLVAGMSELMRRTLGETIHFETVLAGGAWRVFADPNQLESAVVNLCVNARDAMPDGGKLTVETQNAHLEDEYAARHLEVAPGQFVMIAVTDTGTGMAPEVRDRAFDPFYTTKGPGKGTGLGLSQVFGFVKQSGGHVKIYSEPGQGTTVKIYVPRVVGEGDALESGHSEVGLLPQGSSNEVVLVVEDDERVRHTSVDALRELGYTVIQAADGKEALAALELQPRIDLMFTDVVMPDMNGRQLAEAARALRPHLKVLFTTGYTRNAVVHNGVLDAGVAFLQKPFTMEQLAAKVRRTIGPAPA